MEPTPGRSLSHCRPVTTFVLLELFPMLPNQYHPRLQHLVLAIIVIVQIHFHHFRLPLRHPLSLAVALAQILDPDFSL